MNDYAQMGRINLDYSEENPMVNFIVGRIKKEFLESPVRDSENTNITNKYDNDTKIQQPIVPLYF